MATKTFTNKQKEIVARKLGYDGPMSGFEKFVKSDPAMERKLNLLTSKFMAKGGMPFKEFAKGKLPFTEFAKGGMPLKFAEGGDITNNIRTYVDALVAQGGTAADIKAAMDTYGVSPAQLSSAYPELAQQGIDVQAAYNQTTASDAARLKSLEESYARSQQATPAPAPAPKPSTPDPTPTPEPEPTPTPKPPAPPPPTPTPTTTPAATPAPKPPPTPTPAAAPEPELDPEVKTNIRAYVDALAAQGGTGEDLKTAMDMYGITPAQMQAAYPEWAEQGIDVAKVYNEVRGSSPDRLKQLETQYRVSQATALPKVADSAQLNDTEIQGIQDFAVNVQTKYANTDTPGQWVNDFVKEMDAAGISPEALTQAYPDIKLEEFQAAYNQANPNGIYSTLTEEDTQIDATPEDFDPSTETALDYYSREENGGVEYYYDNIRNWFGENRNLSEADVRAAMESVRVTEDDILQATGKTLAELTISGIDTGGSTSVSQPTGPLLPKPAKMTVTKLGSAAIGELLGEPTPVTVSTAGITKAGAADTATASGRFTTAEQITAVKSKGTVDTVVEGNKAITGTLSSSAQAAAAETKPAETALKDLEAAKLTNPREVAGVPERTLQAGELVSGPAVNMAQVDAALIKAEAATAAVKPEMTVQGQLDKLLTDFDSGNPPPWAASSMRNANAVMAARGLGASSLAGQAIIQATLEAAIPIASQDAQTVTALELQNLSNRQQVAVLVAQQRAAFLGQEFDQAFQTRVVNAAKVSDIANLNFTAEQTIALENARLAQTVDLANLSNDQAVVMAKAAQMANLESTNLSNRQQAALQNAQAFLQLDLTNLNNEQQTALFNAEKSIQAIFTDTAAENATKQFNATSTMQVQQFYDSLSTQVSQFNASQKNALEQFNVSQENAVAQFNAQQTNAVAQFNAQNRLIIDQSNAEWRRQISTIDTAAQNTANQFDAQAGLQINLAEYNNLWQATRDTMEYAFKASEGYLDRQNTLAVAVLQKDAAIQAAKFEVEAAKFESLGRLSASVFSSSGKEILSTVAGGAATFISAIEKVLTTDVGSYDLDLSWLDEIESGLDLGGADLPDDYFDYFGLTPPEP